MNSVNSVGDTTHPDNLCKSVKSVGEHLSRVKSAGEHLSRMESAGALRIGILFAKTIFVVFDPPYFAKKSKTKSVVGFSRVLSTFGVCKHKHVVHNTLRH